MNLKMPAGLLNATRLVRAGKLMQATAAIQNALKARARATETDIASDGPVIVEGTARVLDESETAPDPRRTASNESSFSPTRRAARTGRTGRFITRMYTSDAGTLEYKTYIPSGYQGQALPLVIMLHGCKQNPDDFAAATRMNALAEAEGFLVVYPGQAGKANVSRCWNWFHAQHQKRDEGEPSMIAGITRTVLQDYQLDARRVYVAGLSAGGAMAAIMGTTYADLYCAVGIHSGLAYAAARDMPSAFAAMRGDRSGHCKRRPSQESAAGLIPTIVFHGDSDATVHPSNGDQVIAQASSASSAEHDAAWVQSGDTTVENGTAGGRAFTKTTYRDAARKPVIEHWLVHGAGHAWSGGSTEGSYSDPAGPDASREMLRFFLQHARG